MSDKVAWIIGGGTGIGAAVARVLAAEGWTVAISGRRLEPLQALADGERIHAFPLDVTDTGAVELAVAEMIARLGRIDLFIFGAAAWQERKVSDYAIGPFSAVLDANFMGLVRFLDPLHAQMRRQGGGQIVGIASVAGYFGLPRSAAYSSSKAAMISLLQTMRTELADSGIRVRMIAPGFVKSELTARNDFPMPFLMETEAGARRIVDGLLRSDRFEIAFPRRLVWPMKLLRMVPYPLFFRVMRRLPKAKA
ncbi:MAG: oxidoreductase, short-chain dehydrogenase/reductase family [Devosia sp.]|nr:oxidoreductase, short-chain dehydrogenase/reductase family [Devosia sp.]